MPKHAGFRKRECRLEEREVRRCDPRYSGGNSGEIPSGETSMMSPDFWSGSRRVCTYFA
jgi:hypothetical protein